MSDISERLSTMGAEEKRLLLAQLLQKQASKSTSFAPLSYGQRALWFLYQSTPESAAYNVALPARIRSRVDVPALQCALQALINRHASLRTTFPAQDGQPVQQVHAYQKVCFEHIDASPWTGDELNRKVAETYQRPFDLEQGPLLRGSLFTCSEQDHVLLLAFHHIVGDGWSIRILLNDLGELYRAEQMQAQASLPPLSLSYADYVRWQADMLQGSEGERLRTYWHQQLTGELPVLNLPTDHPRPPVQAFHGASYTFTLSEDLTQRLKQFAQAEGVTLYVILLAAWYVQLFRYTDQEDILLGSPTLGRTQAEFTEIVGYFVNMVVLRAHLAGNPTFKDLLSQVHHTILSAIAHQDYPFALLVEQLQPKRDLSRSPIFQVSFLLQTSLQSGEIATELLSSPTNTRVTWAGIELESFALPQQEGLFDLTLQIMETPGMLLGVFNYNRDLFEAATIRRMATHFETLLHGVVAYPEQRLSALPLLSEAERCQLLWGWNATQAAYPQAQGVAQLFEAQVARTPEAVAVVFEEGQLSYGEVNRRANQVAHALRAVGVGPEVLVGLCVERSLEMVIGLLGILKAGGAYVPLDPSYPPARLAFMVADAQVAVVLTQARFATTLLAIGARVVEVEACVAGGGAGGAAGPGVEVSPENLAYVMYTSGSTGQPKGVSIPHRGVVRLVHGADYVRLGAAEVCLQLAPLSFDASTFEIWGSLLQGGRLVVMAAQAPSLAALGQALRQYQVTLLWLTAGLFQLMVDERIEALRGVGQVLAGGEALSVAHVQKVLSGPGPGQLINGYGPTENTTFTCCYPLRGAWQGGSSVPIGRPIANTQVYLLDGQGQPVPVGVGGELYVGGAGLARGYLKRPRLTATTFIPHPWSAVPGARLYKTGDLARYLPEGALEFLGRRDAQVKVRGFRIELGEIETVLSQHPAVREAVALVREDHPGERRLVAYLVAQPHHLVTPSDLRGFLQAKVPDYMVPGAFVQLDTLPLTPNGKVDRRALPVPDSLRAQLESAYMMPQNEAEQRIAAVWQEALKVEAVGMHDNFFELGGHSLLLLQVHSTLQSIFGQALSIVEMFQYPTIHTLAQYLSQSHGAHAASQSSSGQAETRSVDRDIALIGMACQFPGAKNIDAFWQNLREGVESIAFFSDEELLSSGIDPAILRNPNYVRARGILPDIELFDAAFFGVNPREAETMDPQHRLFLTCAWEAFEHAGYDPETYKGRIGVYAGTSMNSYLLNNLYTRGNLMESMDGFQVFLGNDKDFLPTRVSYKLNLKGPSVNVQTACSTSLVAVHLACQSLRHGDCNIALAGGVSVRVPQQAGYLHHEGMIFSPDGHCRAFDAQAQGTVSGNGVGIVILKRLADAMADGDCIHAIIKGSAINNDGSVKVGYTAPSVDGQAAAISEAIAAAGIEAETVTYVETHGTGTVLGDPIEIAALTQAFRCHTQQKGFCAIGSVKTNFGHLDAAAGVAGLIKTALALKHGQIPPSLHFDQANPNIDFANSPFFVNTTLSKWNMADQPRRAGVSSFGMGGTNAHVILEEAPRREPSGMSRPWQLLVLSAKTRSALETISANLAEHIKQYPDSNLADVAYTLSTGRRSFNHRRILVCQTLDEAERTLTSLDSRRVLTRFQGPKKRSVAFMFPGQGAQYVRMGQELYQVEPTFRAQVDLCSTFLTPHLGLDLRQLLYPSEETAHEAAQQLKQTAITQPALFVFEYALAQLWMAWGITPAAMIGHSVGELVAACLAGVLSLEDALMVVATRGRLIQALPGGNMLAVRLSEQEVLPFLEEKLDIAAVNGPSLCVVSGPPDAVGRLQWRFDEHDVVYRPLHTSHAFHSSMMDDIVAPLVAHIQSLPLHPPRIPIVSTVSAAWLTEADATDPQYWARHLRQTVRFADGVGILLQEPERLLLEVGPGQTLSPLARQHSAKTAAHIVLSSCRHVQQDVSDVEHLLQTLGQLWFAGMSPDWAGFYTHEKRKRVHLPTYPFECKRYWIEPATRVDEKPPSLHDTPQHLVGGAAPNPTPWPMTTADAPSRAIPSHADLTPDAHSSHSDISTVTPLEATLLDQDTVQIIQQQLQVIARQLELWSSLEG